MYYQCVTSSNKDAVHSSPHCKCSKSWRWMLWYPRIVYQCCMSMDSNLAIHRLRCRAFSLLHVSCSSSNRNHWKCCPKRHRCQTYSIPTRYRRFCCNLPFISRHWSIWRRRPQHAVRPGKLINKWSANPHTFSQPLTIFFVNCFSLEREKLNWISIYCPAKRKNHSNPISSIVRCSLFVCHCKF